MCSNPQIHIVTHCYARELPQYAAALRYQLSSLVLYQPRVRTLIEVCCTEEDRATTEVLDWFATHTNAQLTVTRFSPAHISRRSIGRNLAALCTHAELVWFTDVDYVFGTGCLDVLWDIWNGLPEYVAMMFPHTVLIHRDHATGDDYLSRPQQHLAPVADEDFVPKRYDRAIGGVQIVPGSLARRCGYLNGSRRYQQPLEQPFSSFRDDVAYRRWVATQGRILAVDLPNLFRLRHSRTTYQPAHPQ